MKKFSIPSLYKGTGKSKEWYVWFRFCGKLIKKRDDINRIKNLKEREIEAEAIRKYYHDRLKNDWNPLVPEIAEISAAGYTLYQALEFALDKKKEHLVSKTYSTYAGTLRFIRTAISDNGLGNLLIQDTKRAHVRLILDSIRKSRNGTNNSYNRWLSHFQAIASELIQWDIIENSPAHKIKPLAVVESIANTAPEPEDYDEIVSFLSEHHYFFYIYIMMIKHTGIRPVELTRLKLSMFDLKKKRVVLPAEITKSRKKGRIVPLNPFIWELIQSYITSGLPGDWYLFASGRISGRGNEGKFMDFIPGPTLLKRDTATKRWKRLIIDGLGIGNSMYSMKRYGGDDMYRAGISLEAIQLMYGHSEKQTTEIYVRAMQEAYMKQIVEKSPGN